MPNSSPDSFPRQYARTQRFTLGEPRNVTLFEDHGLFLRSSGGDDPINHLWRVDLTTGTEALVVDASMLSHGADIPAAEQARRERLREAAGGITSYAPTADGKTVVFTIAGELFLVDDADRSQNSPVRIPLAGPAFDPRLSPDGSLVAVVVEGHVDVVDRSGTVVARIAEPVRAADGPPHGPADRSAEADPVEDEGAEQTVVWGSADFVAAEEMGRLRGFWWSPDGSRLAVCRNDVAPVDRVWLGDPAHPTRPAAPGRYPFAGTANPEVELWIVDVSTNDRRPVVWDRPRLPYLARVNWNHHGLAIAVQSRDQRVVEYRTVDAVDGSTALVMVDTDEAWVELVSGSGVLRAPNSVVTAADRDGSRRLMIDDRPVTPVGLEVRSIVAVDGADVVIEANNRDDATTCGLYRWSETGLDVIADGPAIHRGVVGASGTGVRTTDLESPTVRWELPGGVTLSSVAETPLVSPNVELFTTGPNRRATAVLLPRDHDGETLPVLLDPYGGPHALRVVRSFHALCSSQWLADQGFAVVVIDGRGTPGRGTLDERSIQNDFASVLDDQVVGLHEAAERLGCFDLDRVGIRGWSFGGYLAALAVLRRPDVFGAAVAGAPVTDWRLYDTHYTERYLGDPNRAPDVYDHNSIIGDAARLRRPLMLIHGLADDNVLSAHTLRLSSALLAAGRPHEVLPLVGVSHMTPQEEVAENLLLLQVAFLRRSLGLDPKPAGSSDYGGTSMDERLQDLYQGVAVPANADAEHIAALELLVLMMVADDQIEDVEIEEIRSITDAWRDGDFTFDKYLQPALDKAKTAVRNGEELALVEDIDQRISSRVLRRAMFSAVRDVAGVDHDMGPEEGTILAEVAVRFG